MTAPMLGAGPIVRAATGKTVKSCWLDIGGLSVNGVVWKLHYSRLAAYPFCEMAQLAARRVHTPEVVGSSPALATVFYRCTQRPCVQIASPKLAPYTRWR